MNAIYYSFFIMAIFSGCGKETIPHEGKAEALPVSMAAIPERCKQEVASEYQDLEKHWTALNKTLTTSKEAIDLTVALASIKTEVVKASIAFSEKTKPKYPDVSNVDPLNAAAMKAHEEAVKEFKKQEAQHKKIDKEIENQCVEQISQLADSTSKKIKAHFKTK